MRCLGEVFVEFLEPALEGLEQPLCESQAVTRILAAGCEIWNAACRDAAIPGSDELRAVRERCESTPGVSIDCIEMLISRKREQYGDDRRMLAQVELTHDEDGRPAISIEEAGLPADFHEGDLPSSETAGGVVSMTQALLEFVVPFTGSHPDEETLRVAMGVAVEIWNACVVDSVEGGTRRVVRLKRRYAARHWPPSDIVNAMIQRKRRHFSTDLRLVDHFAVRTEKGEVLAHAEAKGYMGLLRS